MSENNIKRLDMIFMKIFPSTTDLSALIRGQYPWDSIKHIELLNAIELEFKIKLNLKDSLKIVDTKTTLRVLENRGVE